MTDSFPTLSRAIEGFLIEKRGQGRSDYTLHDYTNNLKRFHKFIGDVPINQITSKHMTEFFNFLQDFKYSPGRTGDPNTMRKLSDKTIANARTALSSFWGWAQEEFDIPAPKIPKRGFKETPIASFTDEEVERILKACDYSYCEPSNRAPYKTARKTRLRDKAIIMMLFDTGVRSGKLCWMRYRDLDMENYRILVTGKGRKQRYVYFGKNTARHLWKYNASRFPRATPHPDDYLFVDNQELRPMNCDSVKQLLDRIGKKAGVPKTHPHRFRHTFAVSFLRNGGNVFQLQDLLGNTSLKMCRRYIMLVENDLKAIHRVASPGDHLLRR